MVALCVGPGCGVCVCILCIYTRTCARTRTNTHKHARTCRHTRKHAVTQIHTGAHACVCVHGPNREEVSAKCLVFHGVSVYTNDVCWRQYSSFCNYNEISIRLWPGWETTRCCFSPPPASLNGLQTRTVCSSIMSCPQIRVSHSPGQPACLIPTRV